MPTSDQLAVAVNAARFTAGVADRAADACDDRFVLGGKNVGHELGHVHAITRDTDHDCHRVVFGVAACQLGANHLKCAGWGA